MHGIHKRLPWLTGAGAAGRRVARHVCWRAAAAGLCVLMLAYLAGCRPSRPLPAPQQAGELVVVSWQSPTTAYADSAGAMTGPDVDLVSAFARELGVPVRWVWVDRERQVYDTLARGGAHMAAAALSPDPPALARARFGSPFFWRHQTVAMRAGERPLPHRAEQLAGLRGWMGADSPAERHLRTAIAATPTALRRGDPAAADRALHRVAKGELDYAVVDTLLLARLRHWLIDLEPAFELPGARPVAWAFPRYGNERLFDAAEAFIGRARANGQLIALHERHFGYLRRLETADVGQLLQLRVSRLPQFREAFIEAGRLTEIDWRWLAALAYQESGWDPLATSWTQVRGIMMLTEATAQTFGVSNRLDPRQSILAGARYLRQIMDALPAAVHGEDRLMLALAAYNLGEGHLRAGRRLAATLGLDADTWSGVRLALPQLARPEIAARLVSGPARGGEAVILAENVRGYYEVLRAAEDGDVARPQRPARLGFALPTRPVQAADPIIW